MPSDDPVRGGRGGGADLGPARMQNSLAHSDVLKTTSWEICGKRKQGGFLKTIGVPL